MFRGAVLLSRLDAEISVCAVELRHGLAKPQLQIIVLHAFAVILQRFDAGGLFRSAHEGQIADLEQFGRGEENHVHGIVIERIAQNTFVDD